MNGKTLLIGGGLAAVALYFFMKSKKDSKDTNRANDTTSDLSDNETRQATLLKNYLGVSKNVFGNWSTDSSLLNDQYKIFNVCLEITNWDKVQKKFSALCANEYTLLQALQDGLSDENFTKAINYAKAQKVATTKEATIEGKKFAANTVLGAYAGRGALALTQVEFVWVINEVNKNGEVKVGVNPDSVKIL